MKRSAPVDGGVAAVDRALSIVRAAEEAAAPMTLAELSAATGLYKSTLLRLLTSLVKFGMITRAADGRYGLGPFAFRLGRAYDATYQASEHVVPILQRLVDDGTESASFHVRQDEKNRLCLFRVDSHHSTLDRVRAGELLPLHRGAPGRVLLAFEEVTELDRMRPMPALQFSDGERDPNCAAIACPAFGPYNEIYGAISLSGPRERYSPAAVERMSELLLKAAQDLTESLGGAWPWSEADEKRFYRKAGARA